MGDAMSFPKTINEFFDDYSFKDKEEVYTNGSMLIPTFRAKQGIEHYMRELNNEINRQKTEIEELRERISYMEESIDYSRKEYDREYDRLVQKLQQAKAEAIKEFAERLNRMVLSQLTSSTLEKKEAYYFCLNEIDNLVKEMTEAQE